MIPSMIYMIQNNLSSYHLSSIDVGGSPDNLRGLTRKSVYSTAFT
jgi:hypothetical protein